MKTILLILGLSITLSLLFTVFILYFLGKCRIEIKIDRKEK